MDRPSMDRPCKSLNNSSRPQVGGRKRNRVASTSVSTTDRGMAYRTDFSCHHLGRCIANTKRKITWRFGFIVVGSNGSAVCKDHEVELTWSVKSGKTKIFWNKQDKSSLFKETLAKPTNRVEFEWHSANGVSFRIVAHVSAGIAVNQYDFFVDGKSFFSFPLQSELIAMKERSKHQLQPQEPRSQATSRSSAHSPNGNGPAKETNSHDGPETKPSSTASSGLICAQESLSVEESEQPLAEARQQERLAAAGFMRYQFDMEDELRSELYSSTLDVLRDEVSSSVPETEEIMSRAIINAFSDDIDSSDTSFESLSAQSETVGGALDMVDFELDIMGETFQWLRWSRELIPPSEFREKKLEFMKSHVETIFGHLRHERIPKDFASKLMVSIAVVLGLDVSKKPPLDTVVFLNLNSFTTSQDIVDAMHTFGEVSWAAVSTTHEGFGMCRFSSQAAAERVCSYSSEILINGRKAELFEMYSSPFSHQPNNMALVRDHLSDDDSADVFESFQTDVIKSSDEGIEATYLSQRNPRAKSLSQPRRNFTRSGFDSSNSSYTFNRPSHNQTSTETVSTLSTSELDEFDTTNSAASRC